MQFPCLGADYVQDAAAQDALGGAVASSSPRAGESGGSDQTDQEYNKVVQEMINAQNESDRRQS